MRLPFSLKESGQITLLTAAMTSTLFILFAFVINIGMLVHAKINLQNAADLAAFSGAAVQARQLNTISYLNYEMRRHYKKFLFRFYVLGSQAQDSFPRTRSSGPASYILSFDGQQQDTVHPVVCVPLESQSNECRELKTSSIPILSSNPLDSISETAREFSIKFELARQDACLLLGQTNAALVSSWLYKSDTSEVPPSTGDIRIDNISRNVTNLIQGIGLIPKEIMLGARIETLQRDYINLAPEAGLSKSFVDSLRQSPDGYRHERQINAFLSAYHTLGDNLFIGASVRLAELLPSGGDGANLISLEPIQAEFRVDYLDLRSKNPGQISNNAADNDCVAQAAQVPTVPITVGFRKDPNVLTYYAVRLEAEARILFWPFQTRPKFVAYAAARPFGSRIGPGNALFAFRQRTSPLRIQGVNLQGFPQQPSIQIFEGDSSLQHGNGWDTKEVLSNIHAEMQNAPSVQGSGSIDVTWGERVAMNPNPWELGRYNILSPLPDDFTNPFEGNVAVTSLWAPLFRAGQNDPSEIRSRVLAQLQGQTTNALSPEAQSVLDAVTARVTSGLTNYLTLLEQGAGEDQEGIHIARLRNPFELPLNPASYQSGAFVSPEEPKKYRTSWSNLGFNPAASPPRTGYSVKFVPIKSLTTSSNPLPLQGEVASDLSGIAH